MILENSLSSQHLRRIARGPVLANEANEGVFRLCFKAASLVGTGSLCATKGRPTIINASLGTRIVMAWVLEFCEVESVDELTSGECGLFFLTAVEPSPV